MSRGKIIILSGPSGVGKGTIVKELLRRFEHLTLSVSATTRAPREGEVVGREYYFITKEDFESRIARGDMLEHARYVDNYYGTPAAPVREQLDRGLGVILEIEVQGAKQVMSRVDDVVSIFILPPDRQALIDRLHGRGTEAEEVIQKRVAMALQELDTADRYRYRVVNDDLETAINEVIAILKAEHACIDFN
jgi:guanylate kinase